MGMINDHDSGDHDGDDLRCQGGDAGEPPAAAFPLPIFHLEKRNLVSGIIV